MKAHHRHTWQEITPASIGPELARLGVIATGAPVKAEALGGGVSNIVLKVTADGQHYVVKQALPQLRVKAQWLADQSRIWREADAMRVLAPLLPAGQIPELVAEDRDRYLLVMRCAPETARSWKTSLMEGLVRLEVAEEVGRMLGRIHACSFRDPGLQHRFGDLKAFDQLRVDPYYRTTAARHPDVAELILAAANALFSPALTLVHGDFSPKNILVDDANGSPALTLLDFEVIHFGEPAFDAAFCLNHLCLKALHFRRAIYLTAAQRLWDTYLEQIPPALTHSLETRTVTQLGCLMLARIDGKSPVEYLTEEAPIERARRISKTILREQPELSAIFELCQPLPASPGDSSR